MIPSTPLSSKSLRLGVVLATLAAIVVGVLLWTQVRREHRHTIDDLDRRSLLLAFRVDSLARTALLADEKLAASLLSDRLDGHSRLIGMALFRADGSLLAAGNGVGELAPTVQPVVSEALRSASDAAAVIRESQGTTHISVRPVLNSVRELLGAIAVLHDAQYAEDRMTRGLLRSLFWSLAVGLGTFLVTTGLAWALFERPLLLLADWMRRLRFGSTPEAPPKGLPVSRLADESVHLAASFRAARSKEQEKAHEVVRSDKMWTRDRLRSHAIHALQGKALVVVSNREPYMHQLKEGRPTLVRPASGLVTGLDPVLRACGGLWVAHGAGDADRQMSDVQGCVPVPPEDPRYTLKRVWITKEEEQGYYYGFSNEGLWPLCHLTHERPIFRVGDWQQYVSANQRFANAVLSEIGKEDAIVMVQDYQLALVPGMLKAVRPDLRVGLFWHIPWPNPEAFRICPYRVEILKGMLGADLIGFHLQQHCNNFLDTVDRMVEARLDWDRFSAELQGHTALVRPFPISVQPWSEREVAHGAELEEQIRMLRKQYQIEQGVIAVGVDRIDYTKGLSERFKAIERFFEKYPEYKGQLTFVQLGAPSRTHIPRYRDLVTELETLADAINWKLQTESWKPIRFLVGHHEGQTVYAFLKMARICVVSSLHDGMNLVAKEFIAAKSESDGQVIGDESSDGVLVLSEFAGAARDLPDAIIVNPYDTEDFANAIMQAFTMEPKERRERMTRMRFKVEEFNIYRWASDFITSLTDPKELGNRTDGTAMNVGVVAN